MDQRILRAYRPPQISCGTDIGRERLKKIADYICKHIQEPIRSQDLAYAVGLSPPQFSRIFHEAFGMTPMLYIMSCRVGLSKTFLSGTTMTLVNIAISCGFSSQSHFQSVFKRMEGITPTVYRARLTAQTSP